MNMFSPKFGTVKSFYKNQIIFKEGQPGTVGYLVKSGEVTIYKIIDEKKKILNKLGPGEVFGEMGIVTQSPRTAFAEATQYCDLVVIDKETLFSMLKQSPKLIQSITLLLMKRLSSTLDMLNDGNDEESASKKMPAIRHILSLMALYDRQIEYSLFCKKASEISNASQRELDLLLLRLVESKVIEISGTDQKTQKGRGVIKIIDPGVLS